MRVSYKYVIKLGGKNLLLKSFSVFWFGLFSSWVLHIVKGAREHPATTLLAVISQVEKLLNILIWTTIKYILHIKYIKEAFIQDLL